MSVLMAGLSALAAVSCGGSASQETEDICVLEYGQEPEEHCEPGTPGLDLRLPADMPEADARRECELVPRARYAADRHVCEIRSPDLLSLPPAENTIAVIGWSVDEVVQQLRSDPETDEFVCGPYHAGMSYDYMGMQRDDETVWLEALAIVCGER